MLSLFRRMGWPIRISLQEGVDRVELELPALPPQSLAS
jgi:hypothetical protein